MGRKSKLTDKQWEQVGKRLLAGETARALGREFGVSEAAIRQRFSTQHGKVKEVAHQIVAAEAALKSLPIASQIDAHNLADQLRSISSHLASAANYGAMTAHRLSGIAHGQVEKIDDAAPIGDESLKTLQGIAVLTKMANASSEIAVNLLRANKDAIDHLNKPEADAAQFLQDLAQHLPN
ncbi:MAG TPA: helix-turn-helix domain-containing protein [Rhodocyclaceae bacterium]|nr:helix-turn-helix domain-containing protein [Rhodocyclaceae bacterium]